VKLSTPIRQIIMTKFVSIQCNCFNLWKVASSTASPCESASHVLVVYASFTSQSIENRL